MSQRGFCANPRKEKSPYHSGGFLVELRNMNKKISTPIAIGIILILAVIVGGFTYLEANKGINFIDIKTIKTNSPERDYSCNLDNDCEIKIASCEAQCPVSACVNKDWEIDCSGYIQKGHVCNIPYIAGCQCINNQCVKKIEDETADWKTYTNEEYGFEFRYPSDFKKIEETNVNDSQLYFSNKDTFIFMDLLSPLERKIENKSLEEIKDFFLQYIEYEFLQELELSPCENKADIYFGKEKGKGCDWKKGELSNDIAEDLEEEFGFSATPKIEFSYGCVFYEKLKNGSCFLRLLNSEIQIEEKNKLYFELNQMLSTFKFIENEEELRSLSKEECLGKGYNWLHLSGLCPSGDCGYCCDIPTKDQGKDCYSKDDCEGVCLCKSPLVKDKDGYSVGSCSGHVYEIQNQDCLCAYTSKTKNDTAWPYGGCQ